MEYKKIIKNDITYHLINSNRFKSIDVVFFFTKDFDKNDIVFGNFLTNNLVYSTKKYNTKNKIASVGEDLYGTKISSSFGITGKCETISFSLDFINPKYTEEKYMDLSLDFLSEVILNPNVEKGKFNKDFFEIIKNDAIANYKNIKDNPNLFASIEYAKIMYKGTPGEYNSIPTLDEIEKVNPKNLYDFYKHLFDGTYKVDICILGEVDDNIVEKIHNMFSSNIKSNNKKYNFFVKSKFENKVTEKIDALPFNQSKLYIGYKLDPMNYHEFNHVLRVYNTILGTMNDSILFNIVREANSLCYSIGSYVTRYNPSLTIYAGINKKNYDKTIELIKECVESMEDKKTLDRLFNPAKKMINTYLNNYYDDAIAQINRYYSMEFEDLEDIETTREKINEVTIEEVIEISKKIHLNTIYMLKGDNN